MSNRARLCSVVGCEKKHRRNGYCATHSSRVRTHGTPLPKRKSTMERFWEKVNRTDHCWNWIGSIDNAGYGRITVAGKTCKAHRVSWEDAFGLIAGSLFVLHRCDNRACVRPDHLFLGTHKDNMADMQSKGRAAPIAHNYIGERNPRAKLTELQARRAKYGTDRLCDLAREFGVPDSTLRNIRRGKNWRQL